MACSYSGGLHVLEFSHSLYCPGLEDKEKKGTECFCTTTTKKITFSLSWGQLSLTVVVATPIAVISSRVVIVAIAAISIALSVALSIAVALVPVVVVSLVPVLALATWKTTEETRHLTPFHLTN